MPSASGPCVIQVTNISTAVSKDQLNSFFGFLGNVSSIQLYPEAEDSRFATKVAYVKFDEPESVEIALHLQNTVFNDRALFIQPFSSGDTKFPTEKEALAVAAPQGAVFGILPKTVSWPARVVNQVVGQAPNQSIVTIDPKLQEVGLPPYPALTYESTDTARIEDIRRTIYVSNLGASITCEKLISFFSQAGEVKYSRMSVFGADGLRGAYIEFADQESIAGALTYNGCIIGDRTVRIVHSTSAIDRPIEEIESAKTDDVKQVLEESNSLEEGMRLLRDAQAQISKAVEEELISPKQQAGGKNAVPTVSTLANPPPKRSLSPSLSSKRRSRSRSHSRERLRDRRRRPLSRSRSRSRSRRSRRKRDSRSRSRDRGSRKDRKRSRSRDRDRRRDEKDSKSRKKDRDRDRRDHDRDDRRRRDRDDRDRKEKKRRSKSRERTSKKSSRRRSPSDRDRSSAHASSSSHKIKIDYEDRDVDSTERSDAPYEPRADDPKPREAPMDTSSSGTGREDD